MVYFFTKESKLIVGGFYTHATVDSLAIISWPQNILWSCNIAVYVHVCVTRINP